MYVKRPRTTFMIIDEVEHKRCSRCRKYKPFSAFHKACTSPRGLNSACKVCINPTNAVQRRTPHRKQQIRIYEFKLRRGVELTPDQYQEMAAVQDKGCAICGATRSENRNKDLAIDHDHVTGKFRGLLCSDCNFGIGFLRDDPDRLRKAIIYLESHQEGGGTLNTNKKAD